MTERPEVPGLSPQTQEELFLHPTIGLGEARRRIYKPDAPLYIGWPPTREVLFDSARYGTVAIVGGAFGDEGKGRIVDNEIETLLAKPDIDEVYVVRFQGGNNAGHTIEQNGIRLALHVIPSGVFHEKAKGVMDKGEIIHPEDLQTEVAYVERALGEGALTGRLFLSRDAILCTDLERAEEALNATISEKTNGTTKRGIATAAGHRIDKSGMLIRDLLKDDWRITFEARYDAYAAAFIGARRRPGARLLPLLKDVEVPDFRATKLGTEGPKTRKVGTKEEFIQRLEDARQWLIDSSMVINTSALHQKIKDNSRIGIVFEGSQAAGLDVMNGTYPDVTSSNTTISAIKGGTGNFWHARHIMRKLAVIKATYTSSVGARKMPTHVDASVATDATPEQKWAAWVQKYANEKGTTTGRARDIDIIDLPMLQFNLRLSEAEELILTHLDVAREDTKVKVCTHYTNAQGEVVLYQPNLEDLGELTTHYIELPGWDGEACRNAKSLEELPLAARQYIAFLQARLGLPITGATTGPERRHMITF